MLEIHGPDTHWLFAGRFVIYCLCIVLIIGAVKDLWEYYRKVRKPPPFWSYHAMVITGSIAVVLASPARFEVLRRLGRFQLSDTAVNTMLFVGLCFGGATFLLAQVTRAWNRGVPMKRIVAGVFASCIGIALLYAVGAGIDVRLP